MTERIAEKCLKRTRRFPYKGIRAVHAFVCFKCSVSRPMTRFVTICVHATIVDVNLSRFAHSVPAFFEHTLAIVVACKVRRATIHIWCDALARALCFAHLGKMAWMPQKNSSAARSSSIYGYYDIWMAQFLSHIRNAIDFRLSVIDICSSSYARGIFSAFDTRQLSERNTLSE